MVFFIRYILLQWFLNITIRFQNQPIETLYVAIEGDMSGLLDAADEGVDKTKDKLEDLDDTGQKTGRGLKSSAGIAGAAFGLAAGAAGKLLEIVLNLAVAIPQFFAALGQQAVQANAQFETFAIQFETLLGSAGAAQQRLGELAQFGVETPFELPEIVEANRQLQLFGGNILTSSENMRLIGDAAAGVTQPFQDVAMWVGRMYDAMQNGQPFGEAAQRLMEMGIMSGQSRRELESMQKSGASGAELFEFFSENVLGKFAGNMERLSGTFQGVTSNLEDFRGNLLRVGGEPFFEEVRQSAIEFLDLLNENEGTITAIATGIGELAGGVVRFVREGLGGINIAPVLEKIQAFVDWLNRVSRSLQALVAVSGEFGEAISPIFNFLKSIIGAVLMPLIKNLEFLWDILKRVDEALITGAKILALSAAGWKGLLATLAPIGEVITKIGQSVLALAQGQFRKASKLAGEALDQVKEGLFDVDGGIKAMEDSVKESAEAIDKWANPVEDATEAVDDLNESLDDTAKITPLIDPGKLDSFSNQLIEATENRTKQLEQLEESHAKKIADIMAKANDKRLDIEDKFSDDLADLTADSEKKRLQVIENTRQQLAELATQTDHQLNQRRDQFNKEELRETEDHLKAMRRLQEDYLFDLEDAVRDRDAGAIVDLQRQFQTESQRKEEDFQSGQSRQKQDFDAELNAIRQSETDKREELLLAQEQALADITEHEEEKRLQLEERRQEEMDKLNQNLEERLQRENESYIERQMALDEALQKQLAAIAKNLADEKEVTEEGAKQILETFDEYFGIGGNIDELMANFAKRRKIRADITVAFQGETVSEPERPAGPTPLTGRPRLGGVQEFAEGGTLLANKPTLALFGEAGPEVVQFTPMSQLSAPGGGEPGRMVIEMTGSAPPGIGTGERDAIAAVLLNALQDSGALQ